MNKLPEYNVLLLGETGTGKSTTINAWANYFKYANFDEAKMGSFETILQTKFKLPHPDISNEYIEIVSNVEDDIHDDATAATDEANEIFDSGHSVTQSPFSYVFQFNDRIVRVIDTPGVGDTRGGTMDKENFSKIFDYLHMFKQLHGIVFLLKANEQRITPFFRYCITELFMRLHKSAYDNLMFCFTFSRNSFFAPGDGYNTMKAFFNTDILDKNIIQLQNCFFIDNDAFLFLVASKQGYPYKEGENLDCSESWDKSVEQSKKMFAIIVDKKPHNLLCTTLLNNEHKFIYEMARPMVELKNMINDNCEKQMSEKSNLTNLKEDKKELSKNSEKEVEFVKSEPLSYHRVVCSSDDCCEVLLVDGNEQYYYKTICHENCNCIGDDEPINATGHVSLRNCSMLCSEQACTKCRCPWLVHLRIKEKQTKIKRNMFLAEIRDKNKNIKGKIEESKQNLKELQRMEHEYEKENKAILEVAVKFSCNLIHNSKVPFNKFVGPYLDQLLDEETNKRSIIPNYDLKTYNSLKEYKVVHQQCVEILQNAIQNDKNDKNDIYEAEHKLEHISLYKDELKLKKHTGKQFEQIIENASWKSVDSSVQIRERTLKLNYDFVQPKLDTIEPIVTEEKSNFPVFVKIVPIIILFLAYFLIIIFGLKTN